MPRSKRRIRDVSNVTVGHVLLIGVVAGAATLGFFNLIHAWNWTPHNLGHFLSHLLLGDPSLPLSLIDLLLYEALAALVAIPYSLVFRSARKSGAFLGMILSVFHWLIFGVVVSLIPHWHPLWSSELRTGLFAFRMGGATSFALIFAHLIYGTIVGILFDQLAARPEYPEALVRHPGQFKSGRASSSKLVQW